MQHLGRRRQASGFTLIEVMVVVAILAILAAVVVPRIMDEPAKARRARAAQDIRAIESALDMYKLDNYQYPTTDQGLEALVERPESGPDAPNYRDGGYLRNLPEDPWGNRYQYLNPGRHGEIDVYSHGPDGRSGSGRDDDVIGNWQLN
ncbi:MAG: type II secretion system major pseudopilin GspG [Halofilum sp. (in: g-proteobacteria)]|nr:type II secretion system major pseudopilin GspG [Halofilum sp. (in: g-proteobacteria)]